MNFKIRTPLTHSAVDPPSKILNISINNKDSSLAESAKKQRLDNWWWN